MALYVVVTPYGSKNHLAYGDKNHRITWCGVKIRNSSKRVTYEKLEGGQYSGINKNPVTCENCIKRLMGRAHNQYEHTPLRIILKGDDIE